MIMIYLLLEEKFVFNSVVRLLVVCLVDGFCCFCVCLVWWFWWYVKFVLVGIRWLMIMFFFRLCRLLCLLDIVVFVRMWVVFWNDVVEMKDLVVRDVLVIFNNLCLKWVGFLFFLISLWFVIFICEYLIVLLGKNFELFVKVIVYLCSIWWMIVLMCLLLILMFCRW